MPNPHLRLCSTTVAATGIPKSQMDHAARMAKFANQVSTLLKTTTMAGILPAPDNLAICSPGTQCMKKMPAYLRTLEIQFGPDTSDMSLRAGLHR
jgi:hypothetical protein